MRLIKFILTICVALLPTLVVANTISLDKDKVSVNLKNNATNVLKFPFIIQKANMTTETPENFNVTAKNYAVIIIPTVESTKSESGDLLIWSSDGDPYLIKIKADGKKEQTFSFSSNKITTKVDLRAEKFETGRIESDIKNLVKRLVLEEDIPGYKKVNVKKKFNTPDLEMQKDIFYDGGKYRAEKWFIKNKTGDTLYLDYENFYAPGILGIAFEKNTLSPGQITKAWLILDKHTIYQNLKGK